MSIPTYKNHIDLDGNELRNAAFEVVTSLPLTPFNTQHVLDGTGATDAFRLYMNGVWRTVLTGDAASDGTGLTGIDVTGTTALSKSVANGIVALTIANANSTDAGLLTASDFTKLGGATPTNTVDTLVLRDNAGSAVFTSLALTGGTISTTPSGVNDLVNKSYVDSLVASGSSAINDFDASANPNFPAANKGDLYHVTVAGKVGGASGDDVEIGDSFKAKVNTAGGTKVTVGADWIIMQNNLGASTQTVSGHIRLATQVEVDAGVLTNVAVSPATLSANSSNSVNGLIGDGSATSIVFTHNLSNQYVIVQLYDAVSNEQIQCGIVLTSANTVTLDFSTAPGNAEFRVVVAG